MAKFDQPRVVSHREFGAQRHHRSLKTAIGVAILLALGVVLYEIKSTAPDTHASSSNHTVPRDVANNTRMPKGL